MAEVVKLTDYGLMNVHPPDECEGRGCVVHHPSSHFMNTWPLRWAGGYAHRVCEHDYGHPDPDDLAYIRKVDSELIVGHACDGCCKGLGHAWGIVWRTGPKRTTCAKL